MHINMPSIVPAPKTSPSSRGRVYVAGWLSVPLHITICNMLWKTHFIKSRIYGCGFCYENFMLYTLYGFVYVGSTKWENLLLLQCFTYGWMWICGFQYVNAIVELWSSVQLPFVIHHVNRCNFLVLFSRWVTTRSCEWKFPKAGRFQLVGMY